MKLRLKNFQEKLLLTSFKLSLNFERNVSYCYESLAIGTARGMKSHANIFPLRET